MNWTTQAWAAVERWLTRDRIRFLCWGLLGVALVLMVISFVTSDENHQTRFGSLGEDFAGFYYAGAILNGPTPEKLYDPGTQDEAYYEIFPTLRPTEDRPGGKNLPYIHPPIVTFVFRPLARLPYATAFGIWLIISAGLYAAGLAITLRVMPSLPKADKSLAILLALTFEPFLMECWLGGQLSAIAFLCLALAFFWEQTGRPLLSGLALGLCLYKPTLVLLLLPMLLVARRWWTLLGVALTALFLGLLSLWAVGPDICFSYIHAIGGFTGTTTGTGMDRNDWKFIDLNFFFRTLFGKPTLIGKALILAISAAPLVCLSLSWWQYNRSDHDRRRLLWASTVTWTMVINVYMGIYDAILVVLSVLWTAEIFYRPDLKTAQRFSTFKLLIFVVIVSAWLTQPIARFTGFQIITPILFALAAFQLRLARDQSPAQAEIDRHALVT
jgi:hypothetical protein